MSSEQKSMSIIVTKGSLDWAYPPFILATTAAAMGLPVTMFFTFYGLPLLFKKLDLTVTAAGNPAMKMPMMGGHMGLPNLVTAIPGVDAACSVMMKNLIKKKGVASIDRRSARSGRRSRSSNDRLSDDHGSLRVWPGRYDRRYRNRWRCNVYRMCNASRHQSIYLIGAIRNG